MPDTLPSSATAERIGFVGLDGPGASLAAALVQAGLPLAVLDDDPARARRFAASHDVQVLLRPAELGAFGRVLFAPTAGIATRDRIATAAEWLASGAIVVDLGPGDPLRTRELGSLLAHRGVALVDAPLCGADGDTLAHGCDDDVALAQVLPLLQATGRRVQAAGALGCGHALRLLERHVVGTALGAVAEAMLVGERLGLAATSLASVLGAASARAMHPDAVLESRAGDGHAFATGLALGRFARNAAPHDDLFPPQPGLTRLLIEITAPIQHKETPR